MTNYMEQVVQADGDFPRQRQVFQKGLDELSGDLSQLVNKWQHDMPILLGRLQLVLPQIERFAGPDGVQIAKAMMGVCGALAMRGPVEEK